MMKTAAVDDTDESSLFDLSSSSSDAPWPTSPQGSLPDRDSTSSLAPPLGPVGPLAQDDEKSALLQKKTTTTESQPRLLLPRGGAAGGKKLETPSSSKTAPASLSTDWGLPAAFGCFVVVSLGNRLFQKLMTYPMYNYPVTVNLVTTMAYVPFCFAYVVPMTWNGSITREQREIPKSRFAVMGALDCLSSLMQILAVNFIPNASTLVLLQQSAIPISMVISRLSFAHVRYDAWQIAGAAVVLCGVGAVLAPQASASSSASAAAADDQQASSSFLPQWVWSLTIILSCVPMALSSVYKEKALGEHDVDVVFLNGWIAVFQTLLSFPMAIPTAFATALPLRDLPRNIYDGFKCYVGVDSASEATAHLVVDHCGTAPYFVTVFILFNLVYNVLIVVILKRGSSSLLYLSSTVLVPVNNVMFSLKFVPGHKPLHVADILGLVIIMLGLLCYRCGALLLQFVLKREPFREAVAALVVDDDDDLLEDDETDADLLGIEEQIGAETPERQRAQRLAVLQERERRKKRNADRAKRLLAKQRRPDAVEPPSPLLRESIQQRATLRRMTRNLVDAAARRRRPSPLDVAPPRVARYFGVNQIEMLQPMLQAQRSNIRQRNARTNAQIRHDFLMKLGFSPDPSAVDRSPARLQTHLPRHPGHRSPGDLRRLQQQQRRRSGLPPPGPRRPSSSSAGPDLAVAPSFRPLGERGRSSSFDTKSNLDQQHRHAFG